MGRRKMDNPLALAVLATLAEQARHPYEIGQVLRARHKENSIRINYGSLYTVVQNLERHAFIEPAAVERSGRRPERTLYRLTEAGRAELHDWLAELVRTPVKEFPSFEAALALLPVLPPDEAAELLAGRVSELETWAQTLRDELAHWGALLPRLFQIEHEYELAMLRAEAGWVRGLLRELSEGTLSGVDGWRSYHATGRVPDEFEQVSAFALALQKEREGG